MIFDAHSVWEYSDDVDVTLCSGEEHEEGIFPDREVKDFLWEIGVWAADPVELV